MLLYATVAAIHSNEQLLSLLTKLAKNTIPQSQYSTTIPSFALNTTVSHLPSVYIYTHTTTMSSFHHQFAKKPHAHQQFHT
jgi:hypothetical protein